jgi:hypothetical protein
LHGADLLLALLADPTEREDLRVDAISVLEDMPAVEGRLEPIVDKILGFAAGGPSQRFNEVAAAALRWRKRRYDAPDSDHQ